MILFLVLSNLEKYGIDIELRTWMVPLIAFWVCFMILFGFIEDKLGFYRQEQRTSQSRSPYLNEIVQRLDNIEKKVDKLQKKK